MVSKEGDTARVHTKYKTGFEILTLSAMHSVKCELEIENK